MIIRKLLDAYADKPTERGLWIDYVVAVVTLLICVVTLVGLGIFFYYKKYGAIKAKQPEIVMFFTIAGVIISSSSIVANNHFSRPDGSFWAICTLWRVWIQFFLGFSVWVNCLILRSFRLWLVFQKHKRPTLKVFYVGLAILQAPWLLLAIFVTAFGGMYYSVEGEKCKSTTATVVILIILLVANIGLLIFMVIKTRKIIDEYSEYKEIQRAVIVGIIGGIIGFLFWLVRNPINSSTDSSAGSITNRVILTLDVAFCVGFLFWVPNLKPIIKAIKKDEEYVKTIKRNVTKATFQESFVDQKKLEQAQQQQIELETKTIDLQENVQTDDENEKEKIDNENNNQNVDQLQENENSDKQI
eukprot:Anaeramoba_ignava/a90794_27.p1 GENE.a90794_27~~a90794_27.p1  ORF type:complete len:357 (+),score=92.53 a90794_27:19-1089(+)